MTITFYQATTPNTINVNGSVLWYANVNAHVEFPNTAIYRVSTTDGQQRIISIGVDPGNVDDSNLYNEIINTNPDIVVTNNYFSIRVYGGKANTVINYSGPNVNGTKYLNANGYAILANNRITSNGTYTYVFDFVGTGHRRTITKAIFS
jgi:FlaG/FlaF family flagellin (archaellin)